MFRKLTTILLACGLLVILASMATGAHAADVLVTINGQDFSPDDFRHWWKNWREKDTPLPADLQPFIDWHLQVQEAERMELFTMPGYERKLEVFRKARGRMLLKQDVVDSQIRISEAQLRDLYDREYRPQWLVTILYIVDREKAIAAADGLRKKTITIEELVETSQKESWKLEHFVRLFRPTSLEKFPAWLAALRTMVPGEVHQPLEMQDFYAVLRLDEIREPAVDEYEKARKNLHRQLYDKQQDALTQNFIRTLKEKYQVRINQELTAAAGNPALDEAAKEQPVVTMNNGSVPLRELWKVVQQELQYNYSKSFDEEGVRNLSSRLLDGIVADQLFAAESSNRHYEEQEPFKWEYQFYSQHRLIIELEQRLIVPSIQVDDGEIEQYYQENIDQYLRPGTVDILKIEDEPHILARIWESVSSGQDFEKALQKVALRAVSESGVQLIKLRPEFYAAVLKLKKGDTSPPFVVGERQAMVKLVNTSPPEPLPLAEVRDAIDRQLKIAKFKQGRIDFAEKLRSVSDVRVNQAVWEKLHDEMEQN